MITTKKADVLTGRHQVIVVRTSLNSPEETMRESLLARHKKPCADVVTHLDKNRDDMAVGESVFIETEFNLPSFVVFSPLTLESTDTPHLGTLAACMPGIIDFCRMAKIKNVGIGDLGFKPEEAEEVKGIVENMFKTDYSECDVTIYFDA